MEQRRFTAAPARGRRVGIRRPSGGPHAHDGSGPHQRSRPAPSPPARRDPEPRLLRRRVRGRPAIGSVSLFADSIDFLEDTSVNVLILVALGWSAPRPRAHRHGARASSCSSRGSPRCGRPGRSSRPGAARARAPSLAGAGALAVNLTCALLLARYRHHGGSLAKAAFLSARNDVVRQRRDRRRRAGRPRAWRSAWPDLIVGLGIAAMNVGAAKEILEAAREEHRSAEPWYPIGGSAYTRDGGPTEGPASSLMGERVNSHVTAFYARTAARERVAAPDERLRPTPAIGVVDTAVLGHFTCLVPHGGMLLAAGVARPDPCAEPGVRDPARAQRLPTSCRRLSTSRRPSSRHCQRTASRPCSCR